MTNYGEIQAILEEYGLSANEVRVYLSMLISDRTTILEIADDTEIKRSTVYLIMDSLIRKDLARVAIMGKKKSYFAIDPRMILASLDRRKRQLEEIIPILREQYKTHKEKPKATFYEGRDGVEQVYKEIAEIDTDKEIVWFSSQQEMLEEFYGSYVLLDKSKLNSKYKEVRMLLNPTKIDREYAKKINNDRRLKNIVKARVLPKHLLFAHTDNCIFENKLAIFSIKRDYFVIVIESMDIANTYRTLFDLAWESAVKV